MRTTSPKPRNARRRPKKGRAATPSEVFAALGDPTRLSLVTTLGGSGTHRSIAELTADFRLTRQAVTKHLRILESAGLVASVRRGRESLFSLDPKSLIDARTYLDQVSTLWDETLGRLKAFVER